jgi:DNA polymerase III subunit epsilon
MKHEIIKTDTGYHCTVCNWNWKSKPVSDCPGVTRYEWGTAPENLRTKGQLRKIGLKPNQPRRGIVIAREDWYELFDQAEAVPFTSEEIAAMKEQKRKARYRTCKVCQKEVRREKWDADYQACVDCLPGLLERIEARHAAEEELAAEELRQMWSQDRDSSITWARSFLQENKDALILDTETTGLDWDDEIVQVCVINSLGDVLLNTLVNPVRLIPAEVTAIHGITNEMVKDAPMWLGVYWRLREITEGKIIATYNLDFDYRMIEQSGRRFDGLPVLGVKRSHCAMRKYAAYYGEWNDYFGSYKWQKLEGGDHSALGDCLATLELIKRMASANLAEEEKSHAEN